MTPVKAIVRNGRLVVDEATDLPEGTVIELWPVPAEDLAPDSHYEPVSLRDLELDPDSDSRRFGPEDTIISASGPSTSPSPQNVSEISLLPPSPRAPARSVIARRHLLTLAQRVAARAPGTELAALVREATKRASKHLRELEDAPEGENYLANARPALAHARHALSLVQSASSTDPELLPALEEAASAVGMIFSLVE